MSEKFNSYRGTSANASGRIVVIPKSGNVNEAGDERTANSIAQVHAIYVSQVINHLPETALQENMNYINIGISDDINTFYIGHDIPVVPQSAYYVEKTVTLLPSQELFIEFPEGSGKNGNAGYRVDTVCCAVDIA